MVSGRDCRAGPEWLSFLESTPYDPDPCAIKKSIRHEPIDHQTIQPSVAARRILRRQYVVAAKRMVEGAHLLLPANVEQVETVDEPDMCSYYGGFAGIALFRPLLST